MKRQILVPVFGMLAVALAVPAFAQFGRAVPRQPNYGYSSAAEVRRIAYDRGYREGINEGEKDGRKRDAFRYQDEGDYRKGDVGYHRDYGDVERYRQSFRSGFEDGYTDGYSRYASVPYGRYGRYGDARYGDPRNGGYGDPRYGGYPQGGTAYVTPFDIGAREGYEKGLEDARKNRNFDPRRHEWYRDGDRHYENRYGSRDLYKNEYRRGFTVGYERGFRGQRSW